jgi:hypothetical protein
MTQDLPQDQYPTFVNNMLAFVSRTGRHYTFVHNTEDTKLLSNKFHRATLTSMGSLNETSLYIIYKLSVTL